VTLDNRSHTPDPKVATVFASVYNSTEYTFELSKPTDTPSQEAWYDVNDSCYIVEEPCPLYLLQQDSSASTLAHGHGLPQPHNCSPGPLYDCIDQQGDTNTQHTSENPEPQTLPVPLDEEGKRGSEEVVSEFARDSELAAKELAKSLSATAQESD
jgi:hypothetical protein